MDSKGSKTDETGGKMYLLCYTMTREYKINNITIYITKSLRSIRKLSKSKDSDPHAYYLRKM